MWGTTIPVGCIGAAASWARAKYFQERVLPKFTSVLAIRSVLLHDSFVLVLIIGCCSNCACIVLMGSRFGLIFACGLHYQAAPVTRTDRREYRPPSDGRELIEFWDSRFAEILARCCRVWMDKSTLDPEAVRLAEAVIQVMQHIMYLCLVVCMASTVWLLCQLWLASQKCRGPAA
jgi:hypothetical protein